MSVILFAAYFLIAPLVLILAIRFTAKFPFRLPVFLFLIGPLAGAVAIALVRESINPAAGLVHVPAVALSAYPYGLVFFGLWIAAIGVIGWWVFGKIIFFRAMRLGRRVCAGFLIGGMVGPLLAFALWTLFSQEPDWPAQPISRVMSNATSIMSLTLMGILAGAVCGVIIAYYLGLNLPTAKYSKSAAFGGR